MGGSTGRTRVRTGTQRKKRRNKDAGTDPAGRTGALGQTRSLLAHRRLVVETSGWCRSDAVSNLEHTSSLGW
eukprot:2191735-Amphidinium_carterae.1